MRLSAQRRRDWGLSELGLDPVFAPQLIRSGLVEVVRVGRGRPLVLVPGLAGGWRLLLPLARRLARRHEVILVGFKGDRGDSSPASDESPHDHALALQGTLESLGLERTTVFGVSFGGAVALELAIRFPGSVGGLVLMGTEARFRGGLGAAIARRVLERFPLPPDNRFVNQFFNLLHGCRPAPGPLPQFIVDRCWETDQGVMARRLHALESFDVSTRLHTIQARTLVLAGTRDVIVPAARQRALSEEIAGSTFKTLDGAGHIGFLTHRLEVGQAIRGWMRGSLAMAS
jgi:pimeloyl-ACP methyl ester carboxylesterase